MRKPSAPTTLVQHGIVKSTGQEMAEVIVGQNMRKKGEGNQALGPARDSYLEKGKYVMR